MNAPGGFAMGAPLTAEVTVRLKVCQCGHIRTSHRIFDGGREGCFCGCRLYVDPSDYVRPLSCCSDATGEPIPSELSLVLAENEAAEQRVLDENRPQWNGAEYFAADDLRILRPSTGEMAVVAEGNDGNGLPISVRIIQGDSAQDIFAMSRPVTCEEIEATVNEIEMDPRRVAVRLIELERGADLTRAHLEAIERRMGVLR